MRKNQFSDSGLIEIKPVQDLCRIPEGPAMLSRDIPLIDVRTIPACTTPSYFCMKQEHQSCTYRGHPQVKAFCACKCHDSEKKLERSEWVKQVQGEKEDKTPVITAEIIPPEEEDFLEEDEDMTQALRLIEKSAGILKCLGFLIDEESYPEVCLKAAEHLMDLEVFLDHFKEEK